MNKENQHIMKLLNSGVCLNCLKCTKQNCFSNKYKTNQKLYKSITGQSYNK